MQNTDFLKQHGRTLVENGYQIIPIPPKSKGPGFDGWQNTKATKAMVSDWLDSGMEHHGIGILTKHTVAIDLDIRDEEVNRKILEYVEMQLGEAPVRIGNAPKCVMIFRCNEPFRKMKTGKFIDEWDDDHEVEILADGQQFVAFGIHKDIGTPYTWVDDKSPATVGASSLPMITAEEAKDVIEYATQVFSDQGWKRKSKGLVAGSKIVDDADPFADVETQVDIPTDELRRRLMQVDGAEDYDRWYTVGMALYHQFDGSKEGLSLWHEWSDSSDNYEPDELDKKWESFAIEGKGRAPVTARTILALAKEASVTTAMNKVIELRDMFFAAKDATEWRAACDETKKAEIDSVARAEIAEIAREKYNQLTGVRLSIVEVRRSIAFKMATKVKTPNWCQNWVYDVSDDRFFHLEDKVSMTVQGFNAVHSRRAMTQKDYLDGRTSPSSSAAELALNVYQIHEVYGRVYAPCEETTFHMNGRRFANTYPANQVPEIPAEYRPMDKLAIRTIKNHIAHLLTDKREQRIFLDWLAYIVQNPGKLVNWAMVLQGTEGDGKSFFGFLMREVMGPSNVRMINANILEGNFNGFAQGQCLTVVEEPRLQGQNKYDVINKIKPLITNPIIEIHAKGKDPYNVANTTNYFMPTNFRDALPINANDRRYCVMFSRWQNREELRAFLDANPDYYVKLYKTIKECVPALRKWLVEHEISADFPAGGDAPRTSAHAYMVAASTPEVIQTIEEIIQEGSYFDISDHIVNATILPDAMVGREGELPKTQGLTRLLEHSGYVFLGRFRYEGKQCRYWSKTPEMFRDGSQVSAQKITKYLDARKSDISDSEL